VGKVSSTKSEKAAAGILISILTPENQLEGLILKANPEISK